jgi:hypothetical protein
MLKFSSRILRAALVAGLAGIAPAWAGDAAIAWGTPRAKSNPILRMANQNLGAIDRNFLYLGASVAIGGVGLRNRSQGAMEVSGLTGSPRAALLYWAVVTNGAPTSAHSSIRLHRGASGGAETTISGIVVGTGPSPCWLGDRITVYRGVVPTTLANGNGQYTLRLRPGANGSTSGQSPWVASDPPLVEGAAIVIIGTGSWNVAIYDRGQEGRGLAGKTFYPGLTYQLRLARSVANASQVVFHSIGADGQFGVDLRPIALTAAETTRINGRLVAGPGSPANDGDWNGATAGPLPQLWDTTSREVTAEAKAGSSPTLLGVAVNAPDDCVTPIANIVAIR